MLVLKKNFIKMRNSVFYPFWNKVLMYHLFSQIYHKLLYSESMMPSNHIILCHFPLLPPPIFPSIRVFSNKSALAEFSDFIQECAESDCPPRFLTLFSEAVLIAWNLLRWEHLHYGTSNATNQSFPPEEQVIKYLAAHCGPIPGRSVGLRLT